MLGSNQRPPPCRGRTAVTTEVSWSCGKPRTQRDLDDSALCRGALTEHRSSTEVCANLCAAVAGANEREGRGPPALVDALEGEAEDLVAGAPRWMNYARLAAGGSPLVLAAATAKNCLPPLGRGREPPRPSSMPIVVGRGLICSGGRGLGAMAFSLPPARPATRGSARP
jgi:hypothetical protein